MKLARELAMDKKKPDCSAPYISYAFKQLLISIVKIAFLSEKTAITERICKHSSQYTFPQIYRIQFVIKKLRNLQNPSAL